VEQGSSSSYQCVEFVTFEEAVISCALKDKKEYVRIMHIVQRRLCRDVKWPTGHCKRVIGSECQLSISYLCGYSIKDFFDAGFSNFGFDYLAVLFLTVTGNTPWRT